MSEITDEEFYASLREIDAEMGEASVLDIPGVYEEDSEELNNEVLDRLVPEEEEYPEEDYDYDEEDGFGYMQG